MLCFNISYSQVAMWPLTPPPKVEIKPAKDACYLIASMFDLEGKCCLSVTLGLFLSSMKHVCILSCFYFYTILYYDTFSIHQHITVCIKYATFALYYEVRSMKYAFCVTNVQTQIL